MQGEVQKQIKGMPGQEKMVLEYYQKNPSATQNLKGALYEEKILSLFKSKINLKKKNISVTEAEKIILDFNNLAKEQSSRQESETKDIKESKPTKSSSNIKKKTKKVSKK